MDDKIEKQFISRSSVTNWLFGALITLCIFIYVDLRTTVREIASDVKHMSELVIEMRGQVGTNKENIERLDRIKADKK